MDLLQDYIKSWPNISPFIQNKIVKVKDVKFNGLYLYANNGRIEEGR